MEKRADEDDDEGIDVVRNPLMSGMIAELASDVTVDIFATMNDGTVVVSVVDIFSTMNGETVVARVVKLSAAVSRGVVDFKTWKIGEAVDFDFGVFSGRRDVVVVAVVADFSVTKAGSGGKSVHSEADRRAFFSSAEKPRRHKRLEDSIKSTHRIKSNLNSVLSQSTFSTKEEKTRA